MSRVRHRRWSGGLAGTLLLVSVGVLYAAPVLFVLAVVPLGYVLYGALSSFPEPTVSVTRAIDEEAPTPGSAVRVTLTVTNDGERMLPDVRVVDGVPGELAVVQGSPRGGLAIPAGESRTLSYTLIAKRGDYEFDAVGLRVRSISGSRLVTMAVPADGETTLSCSSTVRSQPIQRATRARTGTLPTDTGGPGLEFHSTREYRAGDPTNRIDWRRFARTDELSTINFREEQAARLLVVVDARPPTRISPRPGYPNGTELAAYAAERAYETLLASGHQVGVTALGLADVELAGSLATGPFPWVDPPADGGSRALAGELFAAVQRAAERGGTGDGLEPAAIRQDGGRDGEGDRNRRLAAELPPDTQVLIVSPLLDGGPVSLAETIRTHDVPVTVLTPSVTPRDSPGGRIAAQQRRNRIAALRLAGATVVDWSLDEPLEAALTTSLPALTA